MTIPLQPTFYESSTTRKIDLFNRIANQFAKASLPAPKYWDAREYIDALLRFTVYSLGPESQAEAKGEPPSEKQGRMQAQLQAMFEPETQTKSKGQTGGLTPETALAKELEAISPERRLFVFLCAAKQLIVDFKNNRISSYRAIITIEEQVAPWFEAQFRVACAELRRSEWRTFDKQLFAQVADTVRFVALLGYSCGIKVTSLYPAFWMNMSPDGNPFQAERKVVADSIDACRSAEERKMWANLERYLNLLAKPQIVRETLDRAILEREQANEAAETIREVLIAIEDLLELEKFQQMHEWLNWFLPQMGHLQVSHQQIRAYCSLWIRLVKYLPELDDECLTVLRACRDDVPVIYGEYLLDRNHDREWIALQLANNRLPIDDISRHDLKIVEKRSMQLLLPLYFQGVERYVEMKNRQTYKYAVRLLKKIHSHYKKTKQLERFESYLQTFVKRHSRLRALHEEMRKGRLIS